MALFTRREFVRKTALAAAATRLALLAPNATAAERSEPSAPAVPAHENENGLRWLEGRPPTAATGATWGMPWPRGQNRSTATFALKTKAGEAVPLQSWPLATWPDGTLKWTAHAIPADAPRSEEYIIETDSPTTPAHGLSLVDSPDVITIDTGVIQVVLNRSGKELIRTIRRGGKEIARGGRLVCQRELRSDAAERKTESFAGEISSVTIEQTGPVRAVVKLEGKHAGNGRAWLPFVVRLYFYAGGEMIRMMHTIIFDGDATKDYISGLGVALTVPIEAPLYDRHVRFSGLDAGLFAEAVRGLTGLRRDPGKEVREAQLAGRATPPLDTWNKQVSSRLNYIPSYADWTLAQPTCDGFEIRKRTHDGCGWISSARGQRAGGLAYVGSPNGGLAFGLRNFWQSYPTQLDIRGATTAEAEVTLWMWSPETSAMDLRPYHDGLGQDTYEKQYNGGLEITYEDYEPGFNSPEGVARTSEIHLWGLAATPERAAFVAMEEVLQALPILVASPQRLSRCDVFGKTWTPVDRSTPARAAIEDRMSQLFDYYHGQREERRWYGFWNYGDVMHTYDADRHEWRYDVGGFGWDNSELSTDIWLWLYFLRSGRADVFRFAEAMTRHTGEVDVTHLGRFAPLGSRHNVQHWGDSAKQLRISTALNRRYYYFLTGDERFGDLMREQIEAGYALLRIPPDRKLAHAAQPGDLARGKSTDATRVGVGFGTDWGSLAGAWLTEWERTGSAKMRDRLLASMRTIGAEPHGFFTRGATMNLETGAFSIPAKPGVGVSHLNAVFGLVEVCAELIQLLDVPEFKQAWLQYCILYNATAEEQEKQLGQRLHDVSLRQGHSRLTAYAAAMNRDSALAQRAWKEFYHGDGPRTDGGPLKITRIEGPEVLRPVDEAARVSSNGTAQWGLAAIECLAWIGSEISAG